MDRKGPRKKAPGDATDTEPPEATEPAVPRPETATPTAPPMAARAEPPRAPASRPEPPRRPEPPPAAARPDPFRRPSPPVPASRPGFPGRAPPAVPTGPRSLFPRIEAGSVEEFEHRHFPRAQLTTNFELWIDEEGDRRFTATLRSVNVSVSGAFLESTFFLPMDTLLRVRFALEEGAAPVEARARIVREERPQREGEDASGFGIRFEEFYGQTEVSLARLFLDLRLRTFAEEYLRSNRARGLPNELERVVDALAAWELLKANKPTDTWRGE
ncbi:MAG TPA: PilZ domain-containing protein [Archangium sp.]|uniref:PilZ domain-containing protein n=1 Tax=Archangium sp. TaxID=1872627 RepID=UPI002ED9BFD6